MIWDWSKDEGVIKHHGRVVSGVLVDGDKPEHLSITFEDGEALHLATEGDCCSHTWIEHVSNVDQLVGAKIVRFEEVDMPAPPQGDEYDVLQDYGLKIHTDMGYSLIEYRNESNGYYGGSLVFATAGEATLPLREDF